MEAPFPSVRRVADVAWPAMGLVFEIQCSRLSVGEMKRRMRDYKSSGFQVVWILHDKTFNRGRLTPEERFLKGRPHYYANIAPDGMGQIYDQGCVIARGIRLRRFGPFPVDLSRPRTSSSALSFYGDLPARVAARDRVAMEAYDWMQKAQGKQGIVAAYYRWLEAFIRREWLT